MDPSHRPLNATLGLSTVRALPSFHERLVLNWRVWCGVAFKTKMNAATAAIQGSGWGWLGYSPATQKLEIVTTANQDPLLCMSPFSSSLKC